MTIKAYFKLVEIQTKVASIFPFLLGTLYASYRFGHLDPLNLGLMLLSLICFDMATTAINNYMDYRTAVKTSGYGYERHNAMVSHGVSRRAALAAIACLLALAGLFGILLALRTDWVVLLLGVLSFGVGVTYTFGPMPTSRTPFAEALSGLTMGFVITFLAVYIHIWQLGCFGITVFGGEMRLWLDLREAGGVFLFALPSITGIANIMLANNICDREDDRENGRFTLPLSIGLQSSLRLFAALYLLAFLSIPAAVLGGLAPITYLLPLLGIRPVAQNCKLFWEKQEKAETFGLAVKNYVLLESLRVAGFGVGMLLWKTMG